jgi:hypothetical protein
MLHTYKTMQRLIICSMILVLINTTLQAQNTPPTWWFGVSGAANLIFTMAQPSV